jgi:hypothetical protein
MIRLPQPMMVRGRSTLEATISEFDAKVSVLNGSLRGYPSDGCTATCYDPRRFARSADRWRSRPPGSAARACRRCAAAAPAGT